MAPRTTSLSWYELNWPKDVDIDQITGLLRTLSSNRTTRHMRCVVLARKASIAHYIGLPRPDAPYLRQQIESFLPEIELVSCPAPNLPRQLVTQLQMTSRDRILSTQEPTNTSRALLGALQTVGKHESLAMTWVFGRSQSPEHVSQLGPAFSTIRSFFRVLLTSFLHGPTELDSIERTSLRQKHAAAAWKAAVFVSADAYNQVRQRQLVTQLTASLRSAEAPGVRLGSKSLRRPARLTANYKPWRLPLLVNWQELVGLLAWPIGSQNIAGLTRLTSRRLKVPAQIPSSERIVASSLAKRQRPIALLPADGLLHMHVMGPTGVGKSTLLLNLISQDITAGRGVVVIDPKGDLITEVLLRIPAERQADVVVLDPSEVDRPVGLNPLARADQPPTLIADDILAIFRKLYGSYFGPRTEDILHAGLLTLTSVPDMSLCNLPMLYTNAVFRNHLVNQLHDPIGLGTFWAWYETLSDRQRNAAIAPVMNKLRAFLLRPTIRRVIGQGKPSFNVSEVFTDQKIFLVSLAKGSLGSEASQLFGSLVVSQVWQAIQGRSRLPIEARTPAFVYIDEVQDYLHLPTDVAEVLVEARSYGVGMIMAHQHLGQLTKDLKSAVLSNARSRVYFQLAHDDAMFITKNSSLLKADDFENLTRFHAYLRVVHNNQVSNWMSGVTLPPPKPISDPATLKAVSRNHYGQDAAFIELELSRGLLPKSMVHPRPTPAIGHKRAHRKRALTR